MKFTALSGRILFSVIFIMSGFSHLLGSGADFAAAKGVPAANIMVPLAGLISLLGGLSIALGYKTKIGGWLIVLFMVPVTLAMHNFWTIKDPMMQQMDMAAFMKNVALTGCALFLAYAGAGPLSLDNRKAA